MAFCPPLVEKSPGPAEETGAARPTGAGARVEPRHSQRLASSLRRVARKWFKAVTKPPGASQRCKVANGDVASSRAAASSSSRKTDRSNESNTSHSLHHAAYTRAYHVSHTTPRLFPSSRRYTTKKREKHAEKRDDAELV